MVTMGRANPKAAVLSELAYVTGALRALGASASSSDSTRRLGGVMEGMAQKLENAMYTIDSDLQEALLQDARATDAIGCSASMPSKPIDHKDHDAEPYDQAQA